MLALFTLLLAMAADPNQDPGGGDCPAGTILVGTQNEETATEIISHPICQQVATQKPAEERSGRDCATAREQADGEREAVEKLRTTGEHNQEELAAWTAMNKDAQKDALLAALHFGADYYTADVEQSARSLGKLERQAAQLDKKATFSKKQATRLNYLMKLRTAESEMAIPAARYYSKALVEKASSAETAWTIARNTMHNEFRVAAKRNASIHQMLADPAFRQAFAGDEDETPGTDVVSDLVDQALHDVAEAESTAEQFEKFTGPAVTAAVFMRDASYAALESLLSTERVSEASDVAGQLAKGSGALQKHYEETIDALKACQSK
jgi:hypothetical protein